MKVDLKKDLSIFSGIPVSKFDDLIEKSNFDICQSVKEYLTNNDEQCIVDIGIGDLIIQKIDDELEFKFIPSDVLQKYLIKTIEDGKSPLTKKLELIITDRMLKIYKELF